MRTSNDGGTTWSAALKIVGPQVQRDRKARRGHRGQPDHRESRVIVASFA
jgi:hypothetical protein